MSKYFYVKDKLKLKINGNCVNETIKDVAEGLLYRSIEVEFITTDRLFAATEGATQSAVPTVAENGIFIPGKTAKEIVDGLFAVLRSAEPENFDESGSVIKIPVGEYPDESLVKNKMIHLCMFPETSLVNLRKYVRLAGVLGYTHVIIESWGKIQFDCLTELGWKGKTFTKEEFALIVKEIKDLKMEAVPMFNSFGHATQGRVTIGKHVVLDRNIRLSDYFLKYGWVWDFHKQKVRDLLKKIRAELYESFGEGEYFHLGLDETYYKTNDPEEQAKIYAYITGLCEEVKAEGRTPIVWGDTFLFGKDFNGNGEGYSCDARSKEEAEKMLAAVPKYVVIADWHYGVKEHPWKTSAYLEEKGYKTLQCPWYNYGNEKAAVETAVKTKSAGVMLTTWHATTMQAAGIESVVRTTFAITGKEPENWPDDTLISADLLRRILYVGDDYDDCGFTKTQVTEYTEFHPL